MSDYDSINPSDPTTKVHSRTLLNTLLFLLIFIFFTFVAAMLVLQLTSTDGVNSADSRPAPIVFKSAIVQSDGSDTYRPPIGGSFHCSTRLLVASPTSPVDANQVRPADIKYIAAMGDSLTTGFLSYSEPNEAIGEMRNSVGNSFVTGGDGELATHVSLANIFRNINPSLVGYSTGRGLQEEQTGLNVAITGAYADDIPRQARELIRRFERYSAQSLKNDWKLINIFIGTKDISEFCDGQKTASKLDYKANLTEGIAILQEALPKSIISIIGPTNLFFLFKADFFIEQSVILQFDAGFTNFPCKMTDFDELAQRRIEQYREAIVEIAAESQSNPRKDQVVIAQHLFDDLYEPLRKSDGSYITDFYADDLFHLSNYGNSLVAKQLWSQLVSPDDRKITTNAMMTDENPNLLCPEFRCPFIRTPSNSVNCNLSDNNVIAGVLGGL